MVALKAYKVQLNIKTKQFQINSIQESQELIVERKNQIKCNKIEILKYRNKDLKIKLNKIQKVFMLMN